MSPRSHLTIGEVLSLLREEFPDVSISKIRFLESQGLVDPERTPSGYRKFYEHDVDRLKWILRQQREHFLPLKVIRGRLTGQDGGGPGPGGDAAEPGGGKAPRKAAEAAAPDETTAPPASEGEDRLPFGPTASEASADLEGGVAGGTGAAVAPVEEAPPLEATDNGLDLESVPDAGSAGEDSVAEDSAGEDSAREDSVPEDSAAEDSAAEDSAAEDSAAEDSAAEDSAAEDSAAEDSAAEADPFIDGEALVEAEILLEAGILVEAETVFEEEAASEPDTFGDEETLVEAQTVVDGEDLGDGETELLVDVEVPVDAETSGDTEEGGDGEDREDTAGPEDPAASPEALFPAPDLVVAGEWGSDPTRGGALDEGGGELDPGEVQPEVYTVAELAEAVGCTPQLIRDLQQFGILVAASDVGGKLYFDPAALALARVGARFDELGVEPRHLRTWRNAADREAGLFEQLVMPLLRQRNPQSRRRAAERLDELSTLGGELRAGLLGEAVRRIK